MTTATPLILLSHGSRHPRAQAGIDELVAASVPELGKEAPAGEGPVVRDAHLEFSADTLEVVAGRLVEEGHRRAVVVPLLFTSGYHACTDVPEAVAAAQGSSGMELVLGQTLGVGSDIADLLARRAQHLQQAQAASRGELVLYVVGSSREQAQEDYRFLVAAVEQRVGQPVHLVQAAGPHAEPLPTSATGVLVVALFATEGLLLDKAREQLDPATSLLSEPLTAELASVVAARYRQAVSS